MANNVILNIYDLVPDQNASSSSGESAEQRSPFSRMFAGILEPLGLGMYHTSIDIGGFRYQFGSTLGISRTNSPIGGGDSAESRRYVPGNGQYRESIILGQTFCDQKEVNSIIQNLRDGKFSGDKYHLAHRNCNHFSETFATALILSNELVEKEGDSYLTKFPKWVNRLAKTTSTGMGRDNELACNVIEEARMALGCDKKVGWGLTTSSNAKKAPSDTNVDRSKKKVLTAKQLEVLAKLKGKSSK